MKKTRYSEEQIIGILKEAEAGKLAGDPHHGALHEVRDQ